MKKTLLVTIDFPPNMGGVANYYENICRLLPSDKIVVLTNKVDDSEEFDQKQSYKIYRRDLFFKILWPSWLKMSWQIRKIIKQENIEMIYVGQILPVGEAALFCKLPFVVFAHGMDITIPQKNKRKKYLLKKIIRKSYKLVANSNFTKKELVKLGAKDEKVIIVHPCPDRTLLDKLDEKIVEQLRQKYNLNNKKIILSVGRLVKRKGFDRIIESLPKVLKQIDNLVYVIVGEGLERDNLKSLVEKLNFKNVIFTGQVSQKELGGFYSLCDVFIMTPKQLANGDVEGFGMVYLEANMFGKPVIAVDSGGVGDAVADNINGILLKSDSIANISQIIIKLITNDNLRNTLGWQGKERVNDKFIWKKQVERLFEI